MKKIGIVLSATLCLAVLVFILQRQTTNDDLVTIGYSRLRISLPVFVAEEKGFFKKHGVNVRLKMFDTAQPLMDALCGGKLELAGYTALPITFNAQLRSRKDLLYTTMLMEDAAHPISMFVVRKDSPINALTELKGKRIGILPTFAYKAWLELILKKNGISPEEVTIQQIAPSMTPAALESGTVEVMFTNDPAVTTCVQKGSGRLLTNNAVVPGYLWSPFPFASFNMTREFARKHPEKAQKIVASLDEAIAYINANQAESKKIMAKFLPEAQQPFVAHYPDAFFFSSQKVSIAELEKVRNAYHKLGIVKGDLKLSQAVYQ